MIALLAAEVAAFDTEATAPVDVPVVEEPVEEAVEDAVDAHSTLLGRSVTPLILQRFWANDTALSLSVWVHSPASRQHAISLRKVLLAQMHLMLRPLHPAISLPLVNWRAHFCCATTKLALGFLGRIESTASSRFWVTYSAGGQITDVGCLRAGSASNCRDSEEREGELHDRSFVVDCAWFSK